MAAKRRRVVVDQVAFGSAVKRRRKRLGVSQEDLADRAHVHRTYLGSVERGERNLSLKNIVAIASALQILPSDLLGDAEEHSES